METPKDLKKDPLKGQKTLKVTGFLEEFEKDDIKKNIDIVELFAYFNVKLKQSGKGYKGTCPFHNDSKTPSLSVSRDKGGVYHCFGCGEAGDAFDLVEKMKGFEFKGALKFLKEWRGLSSFSSVSGDLPLVITSPDEAKKPSGKPAGQNIPEVSLSTIAGNYHKKLYDKPEALEYLKKRSLTKPELYERFQVGFSSGSLLSIIGEAQKQALTEAGILNDKGYEHFKNCLVFPIFDDNENTVSFYGRDISEDSSFKHRYLKGSHKGVFNRKASKVYDEIVLTESIIDALSLIETGLENVQAIYGTNGFTDEHLEILKADRVKTVVLALDSDEAGQKASQALKERLVNEGFKVKLLSTYGGKDWNEALINGALKKDDLWKLINQLAVFEAMQPDNTEETGKEGFKVREDKGQYFFTCLDITYRLSGIKEMFVNSLRVTIRADHAEGAPSDFFIDTVDLYIYRSRSGFASHLSRQFGIEPRRIERDLLNILEYLEKQRDKKLLSERLSKIEITDDERRLGMELLKDPDLLDTAAGDMTTAGYAGEKVNKQLVYLAGTSRLLSKPLSVYIQSGAGSGKSYLIETVLKLMPPEKVNSVTSVSDRAMNYLEEEKLLDCILAMGEALHNEEVERDIRQMQSENMISRSVTMKDPKTGEMKTAEIKKKVRLSFMMTSTALKLNPENASRCLVLNVDESREQTGRVMELQRHKKTFDGYLETKHVVPKIIQKHISAQRMLIPRNIFNPFSKGLRFPLSKSIFRRAHEQFLTLIDSVCFLLQYQKRPAVLFDHYGNEEIEGLECGLPDYGIARGLFIEGGILSNIYDIPPVLVELSEEIRKFAIKKAVKEGIKANEVSLIQSDIRDITDLSNESVKRYIRMLVEYEFLKIVSGKKNGTRFSYSLRENQPIKGLDLEAMIPTVEEMELIINSNNDKGLQNRKKLIII
jgi:DNA primase catalytic core